PAKRAKGPSPLALLENILINASFTLPSSDAFLVTKSYIVPFPSCIALGQEIALTTSKPSNFIFPKFPSRI
ncbi:MAG TPA: hypothetical protein VFC05_07500, partial [Nitrososphaeraceae archaeon]|nr:hypothetical protein [Nitrososphaeraceae archaeon]